MIPAALLVLLLGFVLAGAFGAAFSMIHKLQNRVAQLESERERDRELLEAVLLEDPGKLRRMLGRP